MLDELRQIITNPAWWVSVVIAGIVINLLSDYLKALLDNYISSISSSWRNKSEANRVALHEKIERAKDEDSYKNILFMEEMRARFMSLFSLVLGTIIVVAMVYNTEKQSSLYYDILRVFDLFVSSISFFFCVKFLRDAFIIENLLGIAEKTQVSRIKGQDRKPTY